MTKKTNKKVVAILVIAAISISLFLSKAFANGTPYTIEFTVDAETQHGINAAGNTLQIDGVNIVPLNATTNQAVAYTTSQDGDTYKMTITNGETVKLHYELPQNMNQRGFDLFQNEALVTEESTTATDVGLVVSDSYVACTLGFACTSANGNVLTYNVGQNNTAVTVTVPNDFNVTNKSITGNFNTIKNLELSLNNFNVGTMKVVVSCETDNYSSTLAFNNGKVKLPGNSLTRAGALTLSIEDISEGDNDPGMGGFEPFDGNVYFMWTDEDNNLCYHRFSGFTGVTSDETYETNYVNVTELTDQSGNDSNYKWGQEPANWVLAKDVEAEAGVLKGGVDAEFVFGDGERDMGCQLDPCGAVDGKNTICTNGDMNFRATIYRDGVETLVFGTDVDDYTYFPWYLQGRFFSPVVDISGTTASNPAVYKTYLLEDTVTFDVGAHSADDTITSVKPLNTNANAVKVSIANRKWKIKFNSNYYDHVVFEITTESGNKYYIRIARLSIYVSDNFAPDVDKPQVLALLSYPENMSNEDFDVVATVVKKDGSKSTSIVAASAGIDDPIDYYAGKGLSMTSYGVDVDDSVAGVYFTAVYKGALSGDVYGGTFSGSGKGIYYDIESDRSESFRDMRFDM